MLAAASLAAGVALGAGAGGSSDSTGSETSGSSGQGRSPFEPAFQSAKLVHSQAPVPVLMYHVIADAPSSAGLPELYVDPRTFEQQMRWLKDRGYTAVTLDQVYDAWFKDAEIPEKPIVISFDDGYRGQYVYARPDLRDLGWPGVLDLKLNSLDPGGELTPAMVKRMIKDRWEIDSHTINHLDVSQLSGAELKREVGQSRQMLRSEFHVPVDFFCYPSGRYDAESIKAVQDAGYLGATTTDEGLASKDEPYTLKRIRVAGSDGVSGLERKLEDAGAS